MKVMIDLESCQGHGQCEDAAPEVFSVGDDGFAHASMDEVSDASLVQKARDAASRCPANAIILG